MCSPRDESDQDEMTEFRIADDRSIASLRRRVVLLSGLLTCGCCGGKYGSIIMVTVLAVSVVVAKGCATIIVPPAATISSGARRQAALTSWCVPMAVAVRTYAEETSRQKHERGSQAEVDRAHFGRSRGASKEL
jgi:site-specific DNA recombinase